MELHRNEFSNENKSGSAVRIQMMSLSFEKVDKKNPFAPGRTGI